MDGSPRTDWKCSTRLEIVVLFQMELADRLALLSGGIVLIRRPAGTTCR